MRINIKDRLSEIGMSRYELAKRVGVTYPTIDSIYKGNSTSIKFEILESICKELDCTPIDILLPDDPKLDQRFKRISAYARLIHQYPNSKKESDTE